MQQTIDGGTLEKISERVSALTSEAENLRALLRVIKTEVFNANCAQFYSGVERMVSSMGLPPIPDEHPFDLALKIVRAAASGGSKEVMDGAFCARARRLIASDIVSVKSVECNTLESHDKSMKMATDILGFAIVFEAFDLSVSAGDRDPPLGWKNPEDVLAYLDRNGSNILAYRLVLSEAFSRTSKVEPRIVSRYARVIL